MTAEPSGRREVQTVIGGTPRENEGFDVVINGTNHLFADLELSAMAAAGFYKENYPADKVQIRNRANGTLRTLLGYARLE